MSQPNNPTTLKEILDILRNRGVKLFLVLSAFFITNALVAEFIGIKIFSFERTLGGTPVNWLIFGGKWNFDLSSGVLLWPVVFVMTDIINEYYGQKGVKFLSWLGVGLIAYAFFIMNSAIHLTPSAWWVHSQQEKGISDMNLAFNAIFGQSMGIIIGSLVAFIVSQILDVMIFHFIKKRTGEKYLWLRVTVSTLFSQLVDSFIIVFIAFYFYPMFFSTNSQPWTVNQATMICLGGYLYKFTMAILMTPVTYGVHYAIERYLGSELATVMKRKAAEN